ncbi:hypothetical protein [Alteraurantiacibacter aquimixticola]|nr:hypothetical protein [Alteraurantiacibacter aquimixticola]
MTKAIALTRAHAARSAEAIRFAIVTICGCALIAAGQVLPF